MNGDAGSALWCEHALIEGRSVSGVLVDIVDGRFAAITTGTERGESTALMGFTIPGMANAHSHAFHRALRSRTQGDRGTFWTWRDLMYQAAARLDPSTYFRLARAVFAEMAMAGMTAVGEFHYLHHQGDGRAYDDPNEMGRALLAAADDAGIRITLLDTLYLHGGLGQHGYAEPEHAQRRFSDGHVERWVERVECLKPSDTHRIGAAIHSVRAVDPSAMQTVAEWATAYASPVHAHVSEQRLETEACVAVHGASPVGVFANAGLLSERFTAVHATHVDHRDIGALANAGSTVAMCPTTERDLGDGIGPTSEFAASVIPMTLGSDSHAVIDMFEEARSLELHERLRSESRGIHSAQELLDMATTTGHRSLGWTDAGTIAVGNRADLVTIGLDSARTAGGSCQHMVETAVFAASASDISSVYVDGRLVVKDHAHTSLDVGFELDAAIAELMGNV